jgi:hypothetical protein
MKPWLRGTLAVLAGLVVGSVVNMALVSAGPKVFPPPVGVDVTTMEGLKAALPLFEPRHFVFPFLAHALGTLVGALVATLIAGGRVPAIVVGVFFFAGGAANLAMLPAPMWFNALDLLLAYGPMAFVGWWLAGRLRRGAGHP